MDEVLIDFLKERAVIAGAGKGTTRSLYAGNAPEDGRRFVRDIPEEAFTNWFPIIPPEAIRYFRFDGLQEHMRAWIAECSIPNVVMGRLAGSFADLAAFSMASSFSQPLETAYEIPFMEFVGGLSLGPYEERSPASNDIANLLRQHFDAAASARGLKPVEFANSETGWYFPDDLIPGNRISLITPDGRRAHNDRAIQEASLASLSSGQASYLARFGLPCSRECRSERRRGSLTRREGT